METGSNLLIANRNKITRLKKWRLVAFLMAVLTAGICPAPIATADGIGTIEAHIVRLRNNHGQVICTLFTPSDKFPDQSHKGMTIAVPIKDSQATCTFKNVRYGDYAIVAFHDENHDGEFNQNWLGMPKEGFGFSDNPGLLRKPTFNDAKFNVDQPVVQITIKLNYWL
jgi:uncharacterized protein (DUF2141 family)